jgi:hypothetical protein
MMISRQLKTCTLAALAGAVMLAASMNSASAFTLAAPSLAQPYASAQIEKVWWDHWHHWRGGGPGWGWHRHCWRNRWGHLRCW